MLRLAALMALAGVATGAAIGFMLVSEVADYALDKLGEGRRS